ncbi:MAG: 30S ribosomal protein S15 [Dehalococcoidia bacterium]|nr:30S ribosomal protein S15 [Dehalococcoidia bacterium]
MLQTEKKATIIQEFKINEKDTGSAPVQIAILTERINQLTSHMRINKHDFHTQRGLIKMVGRRRRLLKYLRANDLQSYKSLINTLKIRESN